MSVRIGCCTPSFMRRKIIQKHSSLSKIAIWHNLNKLKYIQAVIHIFSESLGGMLMITNYATKENVTWPIGVNLKGQKEEIIQTDFFSFLFYFSHKIIFLAFKGSWILGLRSCFNTVKLGYNEQLGPGFVITGLLFLPYIKKILMKNMIF